MISDEKLKKMSLLVAIIGVCLIFVVSMLLSPEHMKIGEITEDIAGRIVNVNGTILDYSTNNGNIFIDLSDETGKITAVMFERTVRGHTYNMKIGDNITVSGQINIYKNGLEIIANSMSKEE